MAKDRCGACKRFLESAEPAFLLRGRVLCRSCHDETNPLCPACGQKLGKILPTDSGACPHCVGQYHIRRDQWLYSSIILTEAQKNRVDYIAREYEVLRDLGVEPEDRRLAELNAMRKGDSPAAVIAELSAKIPALA